MNYCVTDNRELIGDYFLEQDTTGRIHCYKKQGGKLEYIDFVTVLDHKMFLTVCKDYVEVKGSK
mgnify:CR=1 FL=1